MMLSARPDARYRAELCHSRSLVVRSTDSKMYLPGWFVYDNARAGWMITSSLRAPAISQDFPSGALNKLSTITSCI